MIRSSLTLLIVSLSLAGAASGAVTIQGNINYQDKAYNQYGYTGSFATKPVRYATIQILSTSNSVLASSWTDGSGNFSLYVSTLVGGQQFNLKVYSETQAVVVKDSISSGIWYVPWNNLVTV